ncbi:hypothetical protein QYF36_023555 [Acer negundo]|nr:hypothetical protein QYF36_023555 [Acer negundo]
MTNIISSSSTRITSNGGGGVGGGSSVSTTSTTTTTTTTQACAACKYQRRKCAPDCILAPYFPHDRQRQFLNAHKLFGVSNITKIIKNLEPPEKDEAMRTIMFQSDVRANDPVGGCFRIIRELQRQIEFTKAELELVLHQLAIFRAQTTTHLQIQDSDDSVVLSYNDIVNVVGGGDSCDDLSSFGSIYVQPQTQVQEQQQDHHHHHHQFVNVQSQLGDAWGGMQEDPTMLSNPVSLHVKQLQLQQQQEEGGVQVENNHDFVVNDQDVKPPADQLVEIPYERHEIKFENDQVVERRRFVPSTQLLISS